MAGDGMNKQQFEEVVEFLKENYHVKAYITRSPDSAEFILRMCQMPIHFTQEEVKNLEYIKIVIPETK